MLENLASILFVPRFIQSRDVALPGNLIHTLRFRLTFWNSLVVLIAALLAMFAVREGMRLTIEHGAQETLRDEATELELAVTESYPDLNRIHEEFARKVLAHSQHDWFAGLLDDRGQTVWKSNNFPDEWFEDSSHRTAMRPFEFDRTSNMLLVRHPVRTNDQTRFVVILGEPTQFINNDVSDLTKVMLMIGGALLFVAPIGGYLLARRATEPVREIIKTTRSLNPSQLDNRLQVRGTGDELDQISIEINSFVDQISKYLRTHRDFIANAAHELRSPLTAIQTSVEVSLAKDRSIDEYREELETVSEQCEHLRYLINQLLELAETDAAGQTTMIEEFDMASMIRQSINAFEGVAEEKGISIQAILPAHMQVKGNESKLRQVFNNLLDNALKFGPEGGHVDVELATAADGLKLAIRDTGPGVPDDRLEKIFERFFQIDRSRQRTSPRGNGLGLSICRSIIELHGGSIHATNLPRGLSVEVNLPNPNDLAMDYLHEKKEN